MKDEIREDAPLFEEDFTKGTALNPSREGEAGTEYEGASKDESRGEEKGDELDTVVNCVL